MRESFSFENEGKDHINVYSKAGTEIGRIMSHLFTSSVHVPGYGSFMSVEGFWHYLSTGCQYNEFRYWTGMMSKVKSKDFIKVPMNEDEFKRLIKIANLEKFRQNPFILKILVESTLPFDHYFKYGDKQIRQEKHAWVVNMYEEVRKELKEEYANQVKESHGS